METVFFNISWMWTNIFLGLLPIIFAAFFIKLKNNLLRTGFFVLWILFLPNTIYVLTDVQYLPEQLIKADFIIKIILLFQYAFLMMIGVAVFILGLKPIEKILRFKFKKNKLIINFSMVVINFLIAFAVALGKIQRTESWYIFTDIKRVIADSINTITSFQLMVYVLIFAVLINIIYFYFRKRILNNIF